MSDNSGYVTNENMYNPNLNMAEELIDQSSPEVGMVSPEERQKACEALVPNGCGPKGDWRSDYIPNNPHGFDFTQACLNHDRNYSMLKFGFKRANDIFLQEMLSVPSKVVRLRGGTQVISPDETARFYHSFVTGQEGFKAYNKAQKNAFICKFGRRPK